MSDNKSILGLQSIVNVDHYYKNVLNASKIFFRARKSRLIRQNGYLPSMKRVTGIGGVFFKCKDTAVTKAWYSKHLGIPAGDYGYLFNWQDGQTAQQPGTTTWSPFSEKTDYFGPGDQTFMLNYRVHDLVALVAALREEGVEVVGEMQEFEYGKFAWIVDCDGRRVELWEPVDEPLVDAQG